MKLSMWMIANRLASFNPQIDIRNDSPMILKGACLVYCRDYVLVHQDGPDCICSYENDTIRLNDTSTLEASLLIQSIFDFMTDWLAGISAAITSGDYQHVIELCYQVFGNPTVLMDANLRVLGISQDGLDDVDDEWRYLKTFGYSSAKAISLIRHTQPHINMTAKTVCLSFPASSPCSNGLAVHFNDKGSLLGHLTVLEKNRPLNRGDLQIMELLPELLEPGLTHLYKEKQKHAPILSSLLKGFPLSGSDLKQLELRNSWLSEHTFQVFLLSPQDPATKLDARETGALFGALRNAFPDDLFGLEDDSMVLLANNTLLDSTVRLMRLSQLARLNNLRLAYSLPVRGLENASLLWKQALYTFRLGSVREPEAVLHDFYSYAVDYLITTSNSYAALTAACHPDVLTLWPQHPDGKDVLYKTLKAYLAHERSITKAYSALNIHKNTLLYRLNKLTEILHYNLDDPYTREYMQLSFFLMEHRPAYQQAHILAESDMNGSQDRD